MSRHTRMPMLTSQFASKAYLPRRNNTPGVVVLLCICTLLAFGIFRFAIEEFGSRESQQLRFIPYFFSLIGLLPTLLALRCLYLLQTATFIHMDRDSLQLRGPLLRKSIPWNRIARIRVKDRSLIVLDHIEYVILHDAPGKKLGVIRDIFNDFPQLIREIQVRSSASRGGPTADSQKDTADAHTFKRRERMVGAFLFVGLAALAIPVAAFMQNWRLAEESLPTRGIAIDAKITRHWFLTDSFWLDYQFTVDGQQYKREVRMDRAPWNDLTHSKTVPVLYAPSKPWINRPIVGERPISYPHIFEFLVGLIIFFLIMSLVSLLRYFLVGRSLFPKPADRSRWL